MVTRKGTALLVVYADVDVEHDAEFNAWYNEEHVPERMSAPGFLNAARYEALRGGPRYLAVYELESVDALQTPEYRHMSENPTDWTKRMSPNVVGRGTQRLVCTQIYPAEIDSHTLGRGMAPALQIGRMDVPADIEEKYNWYYDNERTPANLQIPGCLHVRRYHVVEGWPQVPHHVRVRAREGAGKPWPGRTSASRTACTSTSAAATDTPTVPPACTAASCRPRAF